MIANHAIANRKRSLYAAILEEIIRCTILIEAYVDGEKDASVVMSWIQEIFRKDLFLARRVRSSFSRL